MKNIILGWMFHGAMLCIGIPTNKVSMLKADIQVSAKRCWVPFKQFGKLNRKLCHNNLDIIARKRIIIPMNIDLKGHFNQTKTTPDLKKTLQEWHHM